MKFLPQTLCLLTSVLLVAFVIGCENDDGDGNGNTPDGSGTVTATGPASTSTVFPDNGFQFEISEVGLGEDGWVALRNYTDEPASLADLYLCQPPDCVALPDEEVPPESTAYVAVSSGDGLDNVVVTDADLTLAPPNGELALFSGDDTSDAEKIRSYLQWGSHPHEGTDVAIEAGLWIEGSYAPTSEAATLLFRSDEGLWLFE
jgi:hypothetical protein